MNEMMSQPQLLSYITKVSFVINDITLYLDTHPKDDAAIDYFRHYNELRRDALEKYEQLYSPLVLDTAKPEKEFNWATSDWPWEGGMR